MEVVEAAVLEVDAHGGRDVLEHVVVVGRVRGVLVGAVESALQRGDDLWRDRQLLLVFEDEGQDS